MSEAGERRPISPESPSVSESTAGVGSILAIGCLLLALLVVLALAAIEFFPHFR